MKPKEEMIRECEDLISQLPYQKRRIGTVISNETNDEIVGLLKQLKALLSA